MTLIRCEKCREIFDESDLVTDYVNGGDIGEPHDSCPYCGCDDWEYVSQCECCGRYFTNDRAGYEIFGTSGSQMCADCIDDAADVRTVIDYGNHEFVEVDEINGLFARVYDSSEINDILLANFMQLPEAKQKEWIQKYIEDDKDNFADWYQGGND